MKIKNNFQILACNDGEMKQASDGEIAHTECLIGRIRKEIFEEIDKIIESCKTKKPRPFNESEFKAEYEKFKKNKINQEDEYEN